MSAPDRPLGPGEPLPEFSGPTGSGGTVRRSDLLGHAAVIFFYPKASSPGCTLEAREFARLHRDFEAAGARVVGVSVDTVEAEHGFREQCDLPFDLVADPDRRISRSFGVLGLLRLARRTTFVVAPDGAIRAVVRTWRPKAHAERALELVRAASGGRAGAPTDRGPSP
jgi:thioredoxin-dependent peroxiredoxin